MDDFNHADFLKKGTLLLADASGEDISVCIAKGGEVVCESTAHGGALENFFVLLTGTIAKSGISASALDAVGFCSGPGSVLGIRIVSSALSAMRAANPKLKLFTWKLLDAYAEIISENAGETFSIICPSRKNYANVYAAANGQISQNEILSEHIADTPSPKFFIRQRPVADKNFDALNKTHFPVSKIFKTLSAKPNLAEFLQSRETADAHTLAKREYVKWNSQAHS